MNTQGKISGLTERAAYNYFVRKTKNYIKHKDLEPSERFLLVRQVKKNIIFFSGFLGATGVLFLYIPQYVFPNFFKTVTYSIPYLNIRFHVSIEEIILGIFIIITELWILTLSDIRAVGKIAAIYGFPSEGAYKTHNEELAELVNIGLRKDIKDIKSIGINPFQNLSKTSIFLLLLLFRLKALFSKFIVRLLLKRMLGRLAIRTVVDLSAVPIYAFWNAYAAAILIRKAHMRMYAHNLMYSTGICFHNRYKDNVEFKSLLYDTLSYISITKKTIYPADYLFYKHLLNIFEIPLEKEHRISTNYLEQLAETSEDVRKGICKLIIIGFLIDGKIGNLEKRTIKKLRKKKFLNFSKLQINNLMQKYKSGYGFDDFLAESSLSKKNIQQYSA